MVWFAPLIAGLVGTVAMTIFLLIPRWLKMGEIDVVRAVGALITGKVENAYRPGLIIHYTSGIVWAYLYTGLISLASLPLVVWSYLLASAIHGVIVMLLVSIVVLEHHPMARYHDRGPMTGFAQLIGHLVYGLVVGLIIPHIQ